MEVREVSGANGVLEHLVPSVWKADATTVCILLENEKTERWLVITLDLRELQENPIPLHQPEAA